jgi:hypothetical protein
MDQGCDVTVRHSISWLVQGQACATLIFRRDHPSRKGNAAVEIPKPEI